MKKKVLTILLALCMMLTLLPAPALAADFSDYDEIGDVYAEAVDVLSGIGILEGDNGAFGPTDPMTRAQAAKIIAYMQLGADAAEALPVSDAFGDVPADHWANRYISYLYRQGYVTGVGGGNFAPDGDLTGYAFAKLLLCTIGYDPKVVGLVGDGWEDNVYKCAVGTSVSNFIRPGTGFNGAVPVTRQVGAGYTLNTFQAETVKLEPVTGAYASTGVTLGAASPYNLTGVIAANGTRSWFSNGMLVGEGYYEIGSAQGMVTQVLPVGQDGYCYTLAQSADEGTGLVTTHVLYTKDIGIYSYLGQEIYTYYSSVDAEKVTLASGGRAYTVTEVTGRQYGLYTEPASVKYELSFGDFGSCTRLSDGTLRLVLADGTTLYLPGGKRNICISLPDDPYAASRSAVVQPTAWNTVFTDDLVTRITAKTPTETDLLTTWTLIDNDSDGVVDCVLRPEVCSVAIVNNVRTSSSVGTAVSFKAVPMSSASVPADINYELTGEVEEADYVILGAKYPKDGSYVQTVTVGETALMTLETVSGNKLTFDGELYTASPTVAARLEVGDICTLYLYNGYVIGAEITGSVYDAWYLASVTAGENGVSIYTFVSETGETVTATDGTLNSGAAASTVTVKAVPKAGSFYIGTVDAKTGLYDLHEPDAVKTSTARVRFINGKLNGLSLDGDEYPFMLVLKYGGYTVITDRGEAFEALTETYGRRLTSTNAVICKAGPDGTQLQFAYIELSAPPRPVTEIETEEEEIYPEDEEEIDPGNDDPGSDIPGNDDPGYMG